MFVYAKDCIYVTLWNRHGLKMLQEALAQRMTVRCRILLRLGDRVWGQRQNWAHKGVTT